MAKKINTTEEASFEINTSVEVKDEATITVIEPVAKKEEPTQPKVESVSTAPVENKQIILDLKPPIKATLMNCVVGQKTPAIYHVNTATLNLGTIYTLPIKNKELSLDNSYAIKLSRNVRSSISILDVHEGNVTILPLHSAVKLVDEQVIGELI